MPATIQMRPLPDSTPSALAAGVFVGIVEDSDEDFAVFSRVFARHVPGGRIQRWGRAEALLGWLADADGAAAPAERPDVLVIDLSLPGIDGCELVRRLREAPATADLPLFVLSGSALQRDVDRCLAAGADGYTCKSGSTAELRDFIDSLLQHGR